MDMVKKKEIVGTDEKRYDCTERQDRKLNRNESPFIAPNQGNKGGGEVHFCQVQRYIEIS